MSVVLALVGLDAFGQNAIPPPPAPPPPRGFPVHAAVPIGRPGDWVSDNDYPVTALRRHETGRSGFVLAIDSTGTPTSCQITQTSDYAVLDQTTCSVMMRRARFRPALDVDGKPTAGSWRSSVNWAIPQDFEPLPQAGTVRVAFDVLPDGTVANCTVNDMEGALATFLGGDICLKRKNFAAPRDKAGKPVKKHVEFEMLLTVTDAP